MNLHIILGPGSDKTPARNKIRIFLLICCCGLFSPNIYLTGQDDFISIRSKETIRIDKAKGTALLKGGVHIVHESTQSSLKSEQVEVKRDNISQKITWIKATGKVRGSFNKFDPKTESTRTIKVFCKTAEMDRTFNKALLRGNVVVTSHDFELRADNVIYDFQEELGSITEIPGRQVKLKFIKNATSKNQIAQSTFTPQIIEGVADEFRINRLSNKLTLQGNIKVIDQAEKAEFSGYRADMYFDKADKLEQIIAYQDVIISQPKRLSKADRAVFDYRTNIIILTGNASVKDSDQMEINSPRITLNMDQNEGVIRGDDTAPIKGTINISP